jgi:hypothetical protein
MGEMTIALYREEVVVACGKVRPWYSPARNKSLYDKLQSASIVPVDVTYTTTIESAVTCSRGFSTLKMEAIRSSETSVYTGSTRHHIPENGIFHSHRRENLKSYK